MKNDKNNEEWKNMSCLILSLLGQYFISKQRLDWQVSNKQNSTEIEA